MEDLLHDVTVVAFGGNAILRSGQRGTLEEQRRNVQAMSRQVGELVLRGHRVVVTHGNGPQVGDIMLASELAGDSVPPVPLDVAGAMSQGQLGYLLQQEIGTYLARSRSPVTVCALVTQVVVDEADPAFASPIKPIGRFYTREQADRLHEERGWMVREDAGRGFRRVVPSPAPQSVVEGKAIKDLVECGHLVIAAGGGGVPVVRGVDGSLRGVEAVIDKDLAARRLASLLGASTLILLTDVEAVSVDYGTADQRSLGRVPAAELRRHLAAGQFAEGSMAPKVRAVLGFLEDGGRRAVITSSQHLVAAAEDESVGTQVVRSTSERQARGPRLAEPA